jgi:NADH-quinone oxidoreductase subunit C/D/NADH-quinone oxidoreductase subunit B/C/D
MTGEEPAVVEEGVTPPSGVEVGAGGRVTTDARSLADGLERRAGDLFASIVVVDEQRVRAEGMADLLGDALTVLRDKMGMDELLALTVVDSTDMAEGLALIHHMGPQGGGVVLELYTPLPTAEDDGTPPAPAVPSSVSHWRSAEWLEREAWEMSGVAFEGHPDMRRLLLPRWWVGHPLRRDGGRQNTLGLEDPVTVPGDPEMDVHGFVPQDLPRAPMGGRLGLVLREKDGRVSGARVSVGHLHRGVEGLLEEGTFETAMPLVARTSVRSSVHWQVAYAEAVEDLCHLDVPPRGRALRVALMELERIADHMLVHAATLDTLGCPAAASRVWADREVVMDTSQAVTGQRLVQDAVVVGGVSHDAKEEWSERLHLTARTVQAAVKEYVHEAEALDPVSRLRGLARVHLDDMTGWGISGPPLRSAGVPRDARADGRCRTYREHQVETQVRDEGDARARSDLRLLEMALSARTLAQVARSMPGGRSRSSMPDVVPRGRGLGVVEAPGGEVLSMVVSDGSDRPRRVRLRGPDAPHAAAIADLVLGSDVEDVPLAVMSMGICMGGCDR